MFTERYSDALSFAHDLHKRQRRKGADIPYIAHLLAVSSLVIENGGDEDQAIAGLLHDAVEDQGGAATLALIRERYGAVVAGIVSDCTDAWEEPKPEWRPRKDAYIASLPGKPERSLLVSLADKTHNAESIRADFEEIGEMAFARFTGGVAGTRWYYRTLADFFGHTLPGRLALRLDRAVAAFEG